MSVASVDDKCSLTLFRYRPVPVPTSRSRKGRACAAAEANTSLTRRAAARSRSRTRRYLDDTSSKWRFVPSRRDHLSVAGGGSVVTTRLCAIGIDCHEIPDPTGMLARSRQGPYERNYRIRLLPDLMVGTDHCRTMREALSSPGCPTRVRWAERSRARELNGTGRGPMWRPAMYPWDAHPRYRRPGAVCGWSVGRADTGGTARPRARRHPGLPEFCRL